MSQRLLSIGIFVLWLCSVTYYLSHTSIFDDSYSPFSAAMMLTSGPVLLLATLLWGNSRVTR